MSSTETFAPGNVVVVHGQDAVLYPSLDRIKRNDLRATTVRVDNSANCRTAVLC